MDVKDVDIPVSWGIVAGKAWGNITDYPILMVHGIQDNAGSFDNLIPLLPKGYFYFAPDLPGHGKSSHYPIGIVFNSTTYISCIKFIADFFKWETFHIIAHSFGGDISTYFTAIFPALVTKLVLIDSGIKAYSEHEASQYFVKYVDGLLKIHRQIESGTSPIYSYEEAVERTMKNRFFDVTVEGAKLLLKRSLVPCDGGYKFTTDQRLRLPYDTFYTLEQIKSFADRIRCPILLTNAVESNLKLVERVHTCIKYFSGADNFYCRVIDAKHNDHIDKPERIAPVISEFIIHQKSNL